jgi:hypothetical protein
LKGLLDGDSIRGYDRELKAFATCRGWALFEGINGSLICREAAYLNQTLERDRAYGAAFVEVADLLKDKALAEVSCY